MSLIGILGELAEVGLTPEKINKSLSENAEVRAKVIETAQRAAQMWQEIWDAEGPHRYHTGEYRDSFTITYETDEHGEFKATVRTKRPDAHYLEWGTAKMREFAPAQKTIELLNGELSGATSKKSGGGRVGQIGG
ncbi:HK97 gp10 family phage protein [Mycobacterium sp. NPDC006124]|uniref:HK97 gp10 family phage protein n=1 Tax=Mycobacterium sp. NPDC006124 TaxID=3156729 RepID=UPI0033B7AD06